MEKEQNFDCEEVKEKEEIEEVSQVEEMPALEGESKEETKEKNEEKEDDKKENIVLTKWQKIIFNLVAIVCIVLYGVAIAPKCLQNDTYYTITIGEYIYNNGISDLTQDLYSIHDIPYTYPHWLYDLGIFVIYNSFGHQGIYISTMILTAILGVSIYGLSHKKSKNGIVSFVLTIGSMYLVKSFVAARAQLVTFILFVWAVYAIEKFLETKKFRYAALLVLIPLLIANLHCAVFPFYFILFLPYIGEYFLLVLEDRDLDLRLFKGIFKLQKKLTKKEEKKAAADRKVERVNQDIAERVRKREIIRSNPYKIEVVKNHTVLLLIAVMVIAAFTGFFNPAGDGAYTYLVKTLQGNTTDSINEHLPLTLVENEPFAIALVIFLLVLIFTDTKIRLCDLFMLAGITFLSFNSRRQVSMFAIFCGPILAVLIARLVAKYDSETFKKMEKFVSGWFGAIVVVCLCIIACTHIIKPTLREEYVSTSDYPVEAADWILKNLDVEHVRFYNEYNYGAYLLYRGIPVFIDSRCDLYSPEFNGTYNKETKSYDNGRDIFSTALDVAGLGRDYKSTFEDYGVTHVILYDNSKLALMLNEDKNYKVLYDEGAFIIYERLVENQEVKTNE